MDFLGAVGSTIAAPLFFKCGAMGMTGYDE